MTKYIINISNPKNLLDLLDLDLSGCVTYQKDIDEHTSGAIHPASEPADVTKYEYRNRK